MDKNIIDEFLRKIKLVNISNQFTGQVQLVLNYNQGGITSIERSVKEIFK